MRSVVGALLNKTPVPFARDTLFSAVASESKMEQHLGSMAHQSTLFAIVDRIASGVGAITWDLYRKAPSGDKADRRRVDAHPALTVWSKPNPFYTQTEFVETMIQHFELVGEYWWALARSSKLGGGGPPIEIWPIRPDRMTPIPHPTKFISGYKYSAGNNSIPMRLDQIIFNKRPSPLSAYRGIGPVGTLLMDIEGEAAASAFNTLFFRQGAEPGGVIETEERLSDGQFEEMVDRWQAQHRGVGNAHRVAVLEQAKWVPRRYTQRDMQFEQLRRFSRETFRQAWGFPKPLLGDVDDVNRANAEAAEVVFGRWIMKPRLERMKTSLNDDFLPMFGTLGEGYEFDYGDIVPPNLFEVRAEKEGLARTAQAFIDRGFDPAEVLEEFGFKPMTYVGPPALRFAQENAVEPEPEPVVEPEPEEIEE